MRDRVSHNVTNLITDTLSVKVSTNLYRNVNQISVKMILSDVSKQHVVIELDRKIAALLPCNPQ